MKKLLLLVSMSFLFFLASCGCLVSTPPVMERAPDMITKPTNTIIAKNTDAELPKGTWVKTDDDAKVEVVLEEETLVTLPKEDPNDPKSSSLEKPQQAILPKNTHVILPENTYIQTVDPARIKMEASTEVILPMGTEITITKINWYAILFYCLLSFVVVWYYLQGKSEDKNGDGVVDSTESKETPPTNPS